MNSYLRKKILGFFVKTNGYFSQKIFSGAGHITTFHRVMPKSGFSIPENKSMEVSPEFIIKLIETYKKNKYAFVSMDEIYEILLNRNYRKRKVVALTFDDGYSDNYTVAYPILMNYSVPMNLYITTDFPENKAILWWYLIEYLFDNKKQFVFKNDNENILINCITPHEKQQAFDLIRHMVMGHQNNYLEKLKQIFSLNALDFDLLNDEFNKTQLLNWQQISEMSKNPLVCIGAHTKSHPILNKLIEDEIINEVIGSKELIEKQTGKEVFHFAYPHGGREEVGKREFDILKKLNFKTCTTTRYSNIFDAHKNHLECLPRINIPESISDENLAYIFKGITQYNKNGFERIVTI